ncbi:MAG TPA: carbon monoxide dehydrogenase subunit G [Candidatus Sulfomarinibacteraceae bacterium]|nr:carbon monoxide dehydrogenase subunit G [Candidatus Sulfomarinibacteraceae bacterium]
MELKGEYLFDAPQERVWEALQDPDVLSSVMPGAQGFEQTGENQYAGKLNIRVGPVQGRFNGEIELYDIEPPDSYRINVEGKGAVGFVKASGGMNLTDQGQQTHMAYEGEAQIGGRIATVGQRLLDASARSIVRQSLDGLNEYLRATAPAPQSADDGVVGVEEAGADPQATGEAAPTVTEYKAPSQTTVALNVARDVAGEMIPSRYAPAILVVVVLILVGVYLILR